MASELPMLATVNRSGEVARMIQDSGAGGAVDSSRPDRFPRNVAELLARPERLDEYDGRVAACADRRFSQTGLEEHFEEALSLVGNRGRFG